MASQITDLAISRLLTQYRDGSNLVHLLAALLNEVDTQQGVIESLRDYRGLETAEGVWLDLIGDILGVPRPHAEQPYSSIFAFKATEDDPDDPHKGFRVSVE